MMQPEAANAVDSGSGSESKSVSKESHTALVCASGAGDITLPSIFLLGQPARFMHRMQRALDDAQLTQAELDFFCSLPYQPKVDGKIVIPKDMSASFARLERSWTVFMRELLWEWKCVTCIICFGVLISLAYLSLFFSYYQPAQSSYALIGSFTAMSAIQFSFSLSMFLCSEFLVTFEYARDLKKDLAFRWIHVSQVEHHNARWCLYLVMSYMTVNFAWTIIYSSTMVIWWLTVADSVPQWVQTIFCFLDILVPCGIALSLRDYWNRNRLNEFLDSCVGRDADRGLMC